jgi:hypothetical protein
MPHDVLFDANKGFVSEERIPWQKKTIELFPIPHNPWKPKAD